MPTAMSELISNKDWVNSQKAPQVLRLCSLMSSNTRVQLKQEERTFNRDLSHDRITLFVWSIAHSSDAINKQQNQSVHSHRAVCDWLKLSKM